VPSLLSAIERVPVGSLEFFPGNARRGDVEAIARSLAENEQYAPIVVQRATRHVLAGNHTLKAAQSLGWPEIDVVFVDVDDQRARKINLSSNRTAELGGYDDDALVELLSYLDGDYEGTGWSEEDVSALIDPPEPPGGGGDPDDAPEPPAEPVSKPGDLYLLGPHRLLCGDSTVITDVERLMDGNLADLVFTDPPYGVGYTGGAKPREALQSDQLGTTIYADALPLLQVAAADHAALYLWYADAHAAAAAAAAAAAGYVISAQIIWVKNNAQFVTSAHYKGKHEPCYFAHRKGCSAKWYGPNNEVTVWEANRANKNEWHPTQKPVELGERAIRNSSPVGGLVLDLFGGSGSTLIAAHATGRRACLMEVEPAYTDVICRRFETYAAIKPERVLPDGTTEPVTFT